MECVILAGGLGIRLRRAISDDLPKCMAPVAGKPFLHYLFQYLEVQGCSKVVLSLGHRHEVIQDWMKEKTWSFEVSYVIEKEPFGTGGGMVLALKQCSKNHVTILNGDTYFPVHLKDFVRAHRSVSALVTIALKELSNFHRYGVVHTDGTGEIISFQEKKETAQGFINGGVYAVNRKKLLALGLPQKFSFEKDVLEAFARTERLFAFPQNAYFLDIGIPEDYARAQEDFKMITP